MTVHMFRCYIGRGSMSVSDLETRIDNWKQEHTRWTDDSVKHELVEFRDLDGNFVCHQISVRFEQTDTKSNILQKFEDKLKNKVDYYRVGYHSCEHDENTSSGCGWDDKVEWVDEGVIIPEEVPVFDVQ